MWTIAIQTAVGGNALKWNAELCHASYKNGSLSQVLIGEQRYDLVLRYLPQYRDTREAIEKIRLLAPTGERVSLDQLTKVAL
jgi:cobalt-zinc-cadmium resistance protein CzcA